MRYLSLMAAAVALSFLAAPAASQVDGEELVRSPEPDFLQGIGPHGHRNDSIRAAVVTALGVSAVIYRGLLVSDTHKEKEESS
ncbi:MAG: hypothetical protein ABEK01_00510 [Candidatus Nanohaloarchaea archaeon]